MHRDFITNKSSRSYNIKTTLHLNMLGLKHRTIRVLMMSKNLNGF